jgi:FMN phosphatase YigB (HAD superfamily)
VRCLERPRSPLGGAAIVAAMDDAMPPFRAGDLDRPDDASTTGVLDVPGDLDDDLDDLDFDVDPQQAKDPEGPAPRFVVCDIGEVLVDETRVWATWADILGVSSLTFAAVLGAAISQGEDHRAVFPHLSPNTDWEAFREEHERRYGGFTLGDLYADAVPCLDELLQLGFGVTIAGNQPARRREQLVALGLPHDHLAVSAELGHEKPSAGFFAAVTDLVGAAEPEQVLYVGDRIDNDVLPAMSYGMRTCWLRRGPWGQLQEPPEDVEPDIILEGLGELPLLLQQWRGP